MNTATSPHKKVFRFCVENDAAIATLEGALAIIRRLGIDLCSLRTSAGEQGMEVQLRLAAAEEELLLLCRMRLHNVIGILSIREMPVPVPAPPAAAAAPPPRARRQGTSCQRAGRAVGLVGRQIRMP